MNHVEKLIAKLIDEHKITGEEAIVLIKGCKSDYSINSGNSSSPWKLDPNEPCTTTTPPNSNITWDNGNFVRNLGNGISISQ
jgi:hypothetical protein